MMQEAVMRQIEIIGEASNMVSDEFQEKRPELPWFQMRGIRNKIVHDYRGINLQIIWDTVKIDLPALKKQVEGVFRGIENEILELRDFFNIPEFFFSSIKVLMAV